VILIVVSVSSAVIMPIFLRIATRNEVYSVYGLFANGISNKTLSILAFLGYALMESIIMLEFTINFVFNFVILYVSCHVMRFWLKRAW